METTLGPNAQCAPTTDADDLVTVRSEYLPRPGWSLDLPDHETGRRIIDILERTRLLAEPERDRFIATLALRWTAPFERGTGGADATRPDCARQEEPATETRFVYWDQAGDLSAYLTHVAEATPPFADATEQDKATARRIDAGILEQQRPHLDEDGYPEEGSEGFDVALTPEDWAFLERWFTDETRLGRWATAAIGTSLETRRMHWDDEGSLFCELQWLADGVHPYEDRSEEDRAAALDLIQRHVGDTHEEPDATLSDEEYETLGEDEIFDREQELAMVEITWPSQDWATADRILAGVELVRGYRFPATSVKEATR
jgi:hypothetical protein